MTTYLRADAAYTAALKAAAAAEALDMADAYADFDVDLAKLDAAFVAARNAAKDINDADRAAAHNAACADYDATRAVAVAKLDAAREAAAHIARTAEEAALLVSLSAAR